MPRSGSRGHRDPIKRAREGAGRGARGVERFIEATLAPRLEKLATEIRALHGDMQHMDRHMTENVASLRSDLASLRLEIASLSSETIARFDGLRTEANTRMDSLRGEVSKGFELVNGRIDSLRTEVTIRIDGLSQRLDDALNIRERLVALEARFDASQKRNSA